MTNVVFVWMKLNEEVKSNSSNVVIYFIQHVLMNGYLNPENAQCAETNRNYSNDQILTLCIAQ